MVYAATRSLCSVCDLNAHASNEEAMEGFGAYELGRKTKPHKTA